MPGPEEWRPRAGGCKTACPHRIRPIGSLHSFVRQPGIVALPTLDRPMNPDARTIWQAPSWALAILLACLGMLGPFSIDTYLPAFTGIAKALGASPVAMQHAL